MQNWFVSWRITKGKELSGYQIFDCDHPDPASVLADQVKSIASKEGCSPWDIEVIAFNKV